MARTGKPYFRTDKNAWYARINGSRMSLGVQGRAGKKEAYRAFYALQANGIPERPQITDIKSIVDAFLQDGKERLSAGCYRNYELFGDCLTGAYGSRKAHELTSQAIESFTRKQSDWSNTYRHQFLGFVITLYRWALKAKLIASNPMQFVNRPPKASRGIQATLTAEEHQKLVSHADEQFADFLDLLWLTGARPSEIAGLTSEQVKQSVNGVIVLHHHKSAYRGKQRMLILNERALAIAQRRGENSRGFIFEGLNGKLTANAIGGRIRRLADKAGLRRVIAYGYRHSFATDALSKGIPDTHVASLLGHSSTTMLHKHYSHLTAKTALLRGVVSQVR